MRIARFSSGEDVGFGLIDTDDTGEQFVSRISGHPLLGQIQLAGERARLEDVRLLSPVLPSKVVCIGKNYADHVAEMKDVTGESTEEPVVFLKPSTSVAGPNDPVFYPALSERVDYEGELAVVIGRVCREVPVERAKDVVFGYTAGNDVTARDLQKKDKQWTRGKGFDSFCPIGPWIETGLSLEEAGDLRVTTTVDGEVRQDGRTSQFIHDIPTMISYITSFMTLLPGDVILTGTPAGVGPVEVGQQMTVSIEKIGDLTNRVVTRD
ncbi:2-keto-4-pentenoate hydratase/2-oxohepta-3-ene-1,7-dioic acid hydratase in catechol pathway [Spinactinospora alkalitolerans]|uniref:2-keto-4-pentenoate hydratase/2-oxohepta-3-ene-1,7-dioic acid hydratase in catechol pathway n=1 Tax=Spinactinospora alkalitolerans TaxID=687207 RepID=A0A852TSZ9_9ACTN|nr:fumarylacetoacetate hydrolase family protein [Spinactinospora alkalitolerans]NYE45873.1 2-keto-4-pentenoate hydratase/2-oxohepta-3-ene-1,7-dioic acid hydratase in catechol pathway [Spinactinospora alkalitolerans]